MADPLAQLREATHPLHAALEVRDPFVRLMADDVGLADVGAALQVLATFYRGLEPALLPALQGRPWAALYRPRQALIEADLARLAWPAEPAVATVSWPESAGALLGVIYAVEGSALGGQFITRHLAARLPADQAAAVRSFGALAQGIGAHWQMLQRTLQHELADPAALDDAVAGAAAVFGGLIELSRPSGFMKRQAASRRQAP